MTTENQETGSSVSQDANLKIDNSRRSFAKKSATIAPVLMTLANKTALGATPYHCTVSGQQSGNHSGAHDWQTPCNVGDSPSTWANADQSRWLAAGATRYKPILATEIRKITCTPSGNNFSFKTTILLIEFEDENQILQTKEVSRSKPNQVKNTQCTEKEERSTEKKNYYFNGSIYVKDPTIYAQIVSKKYYFKDVFGGTSTDSLLEILESPSPGPDAYAVASWLNAGIKTNFSPVYDDINQAYIVSVYQSGTLDTQQKSTFFTTITK